MNRFSIWLSLCTAMLLFWQCLTFASEHVSLTVGSWGFEDINAQNLNVDLRLNLQGIGIDATADALVLAEPIGLIEHVSLQCTEVTFLSKQTQCNAGKLAFTHKTLGVQKLGFLVNAAPEKQHYQLSVSNLTLADANFSIIANYDQTSWQASITGSKASLVQLVSFISPYLKADKKAMLMGWTVDSDLNVKANLSGHALQLDQVKLDLQASALNISDAQGKYVAENVTMTMLLALMLKQQAWVWQTEVQLDSGQAYGQPVFVNFNDSAMSMQATGQWQSDKEQLTISDAHINHDKIVQVHGHYSGSLKQIQELELTVINADLAKLYAVWLQPFTIGTAADKLEVAGQLGLIFTQQTDNYQLSVTLDNIFIDDEQKRFGIDDLTGHVGWKNNDTVAQSELGWQGGYLYAVPFGESNLRIETHSSSLTLLEPWSLPILDGTLMVNEFRLQHSMDDKTQWVFDGLLTPVSMESLSAALNWPLLHGKLSGVIPKVSYVNQQVQVGGALMVKLFEGTTVIRDLRLVKPFGTLPQLYANIDLKDLDLEILTQTFDFGKITGKLDGHLSNLRLSNWQAVEFDAQFATPDGDKTRRRISQKAIDNLSQIGGGVGAILSRSFLRFFEDFSYQKLGLNCKLRNETCEMSGVGEAKQGYYIVKGGGLPPRINVVGYTRQVDWPELMERLKAIGQSSGPVIQ